MKRIFTRLLFLVFLAFLLPAACFAQATPDTLTRTDTGKVLVTRPEQKDFIPGTFTIPGLQNSSAAPGKPQPDTTLQAFYKLNPYLLEERPSIFKKDKPYSPRSRDRIFYTLAGLLLLLGFIRVIFAKYFTDLFRIFFQTTLRQKSIREQLLQNTTASLMMNVFFCLSGGLFLYFVGAYKGWLGQNGFLEKALFCIGLIATVYTVKYAGLKISGWLFGMVEVTETYLFIVFLINKVIGVLLLPAVIILALGSSTLQPILLVMALLMLIILYLYRYMIALPLVRNRSDLTGLHFFIYLCAFEVVPVLLIYKLLLLILSR